MDKITLQNYRCFGAEQTARLAPLTLLVGPNNTGKTSFLALIRALWDVAFREVVPNFREEPYDLGSFEDIVHRRGTRGAPAEQFTAGFEYTPPRGVYNGTIRIDTIFENRLTAPFPVLRRFAMDDTNIEISDRESNGQIIRFRIGQDEWDYVPYADPALYNADRLFRLWYLFLSSETISGLGDIETSPEKDGRDTTAIKTLRDAVRSQQFYFERPFASAPVRSRPQRTYDPIRPSSDAVGEYIPSYLAGLARRDADEWQRLKGALERFGRSSGLFDEIEVKSFGKSDSDPSQLQVRKFGKRRKGPWHNLIDMGYGISQALPILVELLKYNEFPISGVESSPMLLLQQPEVHLHPSAQAALGSLCCSVVAESFAISNGQQLVIETHSDYIIDRVRMDVRDGTDGLKPEDVSILYFEPGDLDVKIHSISIDEEGNVLDAPRSYGEFFMAETRRSIGL